MHNIHNHKHTLTSVQYLFQISLQKVNAFPGRQKKAQYLVVLLQFGSQHLCSISILSNLYQAKGLFFSGEKGTDQVQLNQDIDEMVTISKDPT